MPSAVASVTGSMSLGDHPIRPDTVDDLALGLEMKFLLLGLPRSANKQQNTSYDGLPLDAPSTSHDHNQRQAYAALSQVIELMQDSERCSSSPVIQPRAVSGYDIVDSGRKESEFWPTHWIIKKANSVLHTEDDASPDPSLTNGDVVSVEMTSPKLSWTDATAPYLVSEVVSRIKTFPVVVNHTCDIHVHVGRYDGEAFSLPTLKKLATVFWLAEPILRSVRNPRSPNFNNVFTWGSEQRRHSRLACALEGRAVADDIISIAEDILLKIRSGSGGGEEEEDWHQHMAFAGNAARQNEALRAIWSTASPRELGLLLSGSQREHRRLGFNFSAFGEEDERARTNPRTIEFRVLEGTLQEETILAWLRICGKLTELGMKGRQTQFGEVVRYLLSQQSAYQELIRIDRDDAGQRNKPRREGKASQLLRQVRARRPRDVLFADLMKRIGVDAATYQQFQAKIRLEYGNL